MSTNYNTSVGYGFKIDDEKLKIDLEDGKVNIKDIFDIIYHGDCYCTDPVQIIICIKKSQNIISCYDNLVYPYNFTIHNEWETQLKECAESLGVKNPNIGWWIGLLVG